MANATNATETAAAVTGPTKSWNHPAFKDTLVEEFGVDVVIEHHPMESKVCFRSGGTLRLSIPCCVARPELRAEAMDRARARAITLAARLAALRAAGRW